MGTAALDCQHLGTLAWLRDGFGFLGQIAAIALGVFIGVLGVLMAWESITAWRMEQAAHVAAQKMQQSIQQMHQGSLSENAFGMRAVRKLPQSRRR